MNHCSDFRVINNHSESQLEQRLTKTNTAPNYSRGLAVALNATTTVEISQFAECGWLFWAN
jgi:hypothetical protein